MDERTPIVCFGCYDYWSSNPGSPVQIADSFHELGHKVLWINNIGMNLPNLRRSGLGARVRMRLKAWSRWLRPHRAGFWVLAPIVLPIYGNRTLESINEAWLLLQIRLAYLLLGLRRPLAFVCMPAFAGAVARLPRQGLIYYYTDKYDSYRHLRNREAIQARDRALLGSADVVFCASRAIMRSLPLQRPHVHHLPHAVDFAAFDSALNRGAPPPEDIAVIPRPRIGYFGSLTDSNDIAMIRHAAVCDPSLHFVLIGRVLGDYSSIAGLPNVHMLGFKPMVEIPNYGMCFDVGIMNWKMTEWIRHCSPVKTREYLALGLPIVSVAIEEVMSEFGDLVEIADTPEAFLAAIRSCLSNDSQELRDRRRARVSGDSWLNRASTILALYEEAHHDH